MTEVKSLKNLIKIRILIFILTVPIIITLVVFLIINSWLFGETMIGTAEMYITIGFIVIMNILIGSLMIFMEKVKLKGSFYEENVVFYKINVLRFVFYFLFSFVIFYFLLTNYDQVNMSFEDINLQTRIIIVIFAVLTFSINGLHITKIDKKTTGKIMTP